MPDERWRNEQALNGIPKDRWTEIAARLARLASEHVGIADAYPVDEVLADLDRGKRPHPAQLSRPGDLMAELEYLYYGQGEAQVRAAVETLFAAAEPRARRSPLDVLLHARLAVDDHGTAVIDRIRADVGFAG